ncbi:uncharacterized protein [Dendropsophus ebraccatus]|uniref:uncharacterized protein n=1 Tax=Dendropsophus ebraccatus TaxID=150705 RepID=UPI0038317290
MEPKSTRVPEPDRKMGNSGGGPIRHKEKQKSGKVLLPKPKGQSGGGGRANPAMEFPSSLRVSSISPVRKSTTENPSCSYSGNLHSSGMAKKKLVLSPKKADNRRSPPTTSKGRSSRPGPAKSPRDSTTPLSGLATEKSLLARRGLSPRVIDTMLSSKKDVTSSIYLKYWRKFCTWCGDIPPDPCKPNMPQILDFLQQGLDKGLSLSTLKVQVSALGCFFDSPIAEHRWVKRFFKAVSRLKPKISNLTPPWDLNLVLQALTQKPFEPIQELSTRFLTLKTIFLVAITSAKRVGEIQALSTEEPYLTVLDDRIVLKLNPSFLPKVVSNFHRSQDIILPSFCDPPKNDQEICFHTLDVRRAVLTYLQNTKTWRIDANLFLQFQGPNRGKKASKASISRWMKSAIAEAYKASNREVPKALKAHSTRAMSVSWAEKSAASLEQICRAATWSSPHTFYRHYKLNVATSQDLAFGRKVLQAVVPP